MAQKVIWFWQVKEGETFNSSKDRLDFVGVKIDPIHNFNAVMTLYGWRNDEKFLGPLSGSLINVENQAVVEVER